MPESPTHQEGPAYQLEAQWCDHCRLSFNPYDQVHATNGLFFHVDCFEQAS